MAFSDANRASLRYIQESNTLWGTTPASGNTRAVRLTSSSIAAGKETVVSDELRFDRMVSSVPEVSANSAGDINYEFSAGSHDDFVAAFLQGQWSRPMTFDFVKGSNVSWTSTSAITVTGLDVSDLFVAGRRVRTSGFVDINNNDYFQISTSVFGAGNTVITMTTTTGIVETSSAFTKIEDANDVVVLKNTTVSAVNSTSSFDGTGVFTSAIAAGEFAVGMTVYVDGLSYEEGLVTFSVAAAADAETVTIGDGTNTVIFEFETSGGVTAGNVSVAPGASFTDSATNLTAAINAQRLAGSLDVAASSAAGGVTCRNLNKVSGSLAETGTNIVVTTPFAGGIADTTGYFEVTNLENDKMTVTPAPTDQSAGDTVTIKASMARNPSGVPGGTLPHEVITPQSFTIETAFNDVNQFLLTRGLRVGTYSMDLTTGAIVTGTFSFNGRDTGRSGTDTLGLAPYTALGTTATEVMNATTNVGTVKKDGVVLATKFSALSFSGDASLRDQNAIGSKFPEGIGSGRFNLTGSVTAYFEDGALYDEFINHDTVSLAWTYTDNDNNSYVYTIPAVKFTSDPLAPGGIDQDVFEEIEWSAFRDATRATMMQIDRFSNVTPPTVS